jgi:glucosamine--fructose-6-phosphate aminotransferase (isomerizing)
MKYAGCCNCPKLGHYDKIVSNIQEIKSRSGRNCSGNQGDTRLGELAVMLLNPRNSDALSPLITTIPLQLLSYHIAVLRGCNVDQPRNLAKSVTE